MMRTLLFGMVLGAGLLAAVNSQVHAQYSHGFYFDNGRVAYGQWWSLGRNGFSNGFYVQTPQYTHYQGQSSGHGRQGATYFHARPGVTYGQRYSVGRHHFRSGSVYRRR